MIYGAMFDEPDERTAMFNLPPRPAQLPAQGSFVSLNVDGCALPSDCYLPPAGEAAKTLCGAETDFRGNVRHAAVMRHAVGFGSHAKSGSQTLPSSFMQRKRDAIRWFGNKGNR